MRKFMTMALKIVSVAASGTLIVLIRVYQVVFSPLVGRCCRFYPSCSAYAIEAIRRHGCVKGAGLAVWRLLRCNPFNPGGVDHVPGKSVHCYPTKELRRLI